MLSGKYNTLAAQGDLEERSRVEVPLTLLKLKTRTRNCNHRNGANHPGEIKTLADSAPIMVLYRRYSGKAHLEGFRWFEGVKKTKAELYDYIFRSGQTVINSDNKHLTEMAIKGGFDMKAVVVVPSLDSETSLCPCTWKRDFGCTFSEYEVYTQKQPWLGSHTKLIGSYNAENVLAAVAIGDFFGVAAETIKKGLENSTEQSLRNLQWRTRNELLVNTTMPTLSCAGGVAELWWNRCEHKVVILGDMLELGDQSAENIESIVAPADWANYFWKSDLEPRFKKTQHNFWKLRKCLA